jgi:hypothetical protein
MNSRRTAGILKKLVFYYNNPGGIKKAEKEPPYDEIPH